MFNVYYLFHVVGTHKCNSLPRDNQMCVQCAQQNRFLILFWCHFTKTGHFEEIKIKFGCAITLVPLFRMSNLHERDAVYTQRSTDGQPC